MIDPETAYLNGIEAGAAAALAHTTRHVSPDPARRRSILLQTTDSAGRTVVVSLRPEATSLGAVLSWVAEARFAERHGEG